MNLKRLLRERFQHAVPEGGEPGGGVGDPATPVGDPVAPVAAPAGDPAAPAGDDWRSALPADLRENTTLQDVKSVEALAKRFIDTKSMVGNSIRVPSQDASAEDHAAFRQSLLEKNVGLMEVPNFEDNDGLQAAYKAMGLPEDAAGYARPEDWSGMTDERFGFIAGEAHKAGLNKKQFEYMTKVLAEADNTASSEFEDTRLQGIEQLKGEWGRAYDQKTSRASVIAKQLEAPPALQDALASGRVDAGTLRWLDTISEKFGKEGTALVTEPGSQVSENTPSELNERVREITKKMLEMDANDPEYQVLLKKRVQYAELLNPSK